MLTRIVIEYQKQYVLFVEQSEKSINEIRKVILNFVKMDQEIKHLQEAVEYVKQQVFFLIQLMLFCYFRHLC
jgi:hypothetical protein